MKAVKDRYFVHLRRSKLEMSLVDTSSPPTGGEEDEVVKATTIATGKPPIIILPTPPLSTLWTKEEVSRLMFTILNASTTSYFVKPCVLLSLLCLGRENVTRPVAAT